MSKFTRRSGGPYIIAAQCVRIGRVALTPPPTEYCPNIKTSRARTHRCGGTSARHLRAVPLQCCQRASTAAAAATVSSRHDRCSPPLVRMRAAVHRRIIVVAYLRARVQIIFMCVRVVPTSSTPHSPGHIVIMRACVVYVRLRDAVPAVFLRGSE